MSFKKIIPWLAGILTLLLAFAAVPLTRLWMFVGQMPARDLRKGDPAPGMGGFSEFSGPMMGVRTGSLMGGFEVIILPLFFVTLFLFTVWAFQKIVRASAQSAVDNNIPHTGHICPNCGRATAEDWRFCPHCGTDIQLQSSPPDAD
jgi:hypothetical protein